MKTLTMNDTMPFGKYKGLPIQAMLSQKLYCEFIPYLQWAIDTWDNIKFTDDIKQEVKRQILEENCRIAEFRNNYNNKYPAERKYKKGYSEDYGAFSCPGDDMGMGPSDYGIPYC